METKEDRQKRLKRERNQRFRDKKKTANLLVFPDSSSSQDEGVKLQNHTLDNKSSSRNRLGLLGSVLLSVFITVLLCYFQAHTYIEDGMSKPLSWAISIVCETSLCYLSTTLKSSRMSAFLWLSLFSYNLSTMSYGLLKSETTNVAVITRSLYINKTLEDVFESTRLAFNLSIERGQIKSAQNMLKSMEDLGDKITGKRENMPKIETEKAIELLRFQTYGLIILRAILMLLNAVLIHRIFVDARGKF